VGTGSIEGDKEISPLASLLTRVSPLPAERAAHRTVTCLTHGRCSQVDERLVYRLDYTNNVVSVHVVFLAQTVVRLTPESRNRMFKTNSNVKLLQSAAAVE